MVSFQSVVDALIGQELHKRFGTAVALDGLDLTVAAGEIHGFLGPNGAGKSTTIRALLGVLRLDSGSIRLLGQDPWKDAVSLHRRIAYVPGDVALWPNLTGGEVIDLLSRLRGGVDMQRRERLIEQFDLDPTKKGRAYSKGNRQKVALIAALVTRSDMLLLDEPTSGLDPLMEKVFRDAVLQARNDGCTVLLSSHILSEVEALCDRVTIVRAGRNIESGSLDELRHIARTTVIAETKRHLDLASTDGVHNVVVEGSRVQCAVENAALGNVLELISNAGVTSLTARPPTLEELFLCQYSDKQR